MTFYLKVAVARPDAADSHPAPPQRLGSLLHAKPLALEEGFGKTRGAALNMHNSQEHKRNSWVMGARRRPSNT